MQRVLLDVPPMRRSTTNPALRNLYGGFAQDIICRALNINGVPINGNYRECFDGEFAGNHYEIKSCRRRGKVVVYKFRLEKEEKFKDSLRYALFLHQFSGQETYVELLEECRMRPPMLAILPFTKIRDLALEQPLKKIISKIDESDPTFKRIGYQRVGYADGFYNIPVKEIMKHVTPLGIIKFRAFDCDLCLTLLT